jgi:flagellar hook protein FlgE
MNFSKYALSLVISLSVSYCSNPARVTNDPEILDSSQGFIDYYFGQSNIKTTGNIMDIALEGKGLFVLNKDNQNFYLRRPGSFHIDQDGYLVHDVNGPKLLGYKADDTHSFPDTTINETGLLEPIRIPLYTLPCPPRHTTKISGSGNLDIETFSYSLRGVYDAAVEIWDSDGKGHTLTFFISNSDTINNWNWEVVADGYGTPEGITIISGGRGTIKFNPDGSFSTLQYLGADSLAIAVNSDTFAIEVDFGWPGSYLGLVQTLYPTTFAITSQDGYPPGKLDEISIDQWGNITGAFNNGISQRLWVIPIALFPCFECLAFTADSEYFIGTEISGQPIIGQPGLTTSAIFRPGALEIE